MLKINQNDLLGFNFGGEASFMTLRLRTSGGSARPVKRLLKRDGDSTAGVAGGVAVGVASRFFILTSSLPSSNIRTYR